MKTDLYTKAMLTIIAICLLVVASEKIYDIVAPEAEAQTKGKWQCINGPETYEAVGSRWFMENWFEKLANEKSWTFMVMYPLPISSTGDTHTSTDKVIRKDWMVACGY